MMIEQVKALLAEQALTQAAIIDDAFDDRPTVDDLDADLWDRFFDDLSEEDEDGLAKAYGKDITKAEPSDLRRDVAFISAVWALRDEIEAAEDLFEDYVVKQAGKRADLKPLEAWSEWADDLRGFAVPTGQYPAEHRPDLIYPAFWSFFTGREPEMVDAA